MSKQEVDAYIEALDQRQQSALSELRQTILEIVPEAEQGMAYDIPGFRLRGKIIAGFAAFQHHLSYFPHSGSVLPVLQEELADYSTSKGTLRFSVDKPLPRQLVQRLLAVRVEQALKESLD